MSSIEHKFIRFPRLLPGLLWGIMFLFPVKLLGAEQPEPFAAQSAPLATQPATLAPQPVLLTPQTAPQTSKHDSFDSLESSRDYMSGKITSFASYLDRFFGGDRHYQESNGTVVQLDLTKLNGHGSDHKFDFAARANLRLPVTEGRLHLLLETNPEANITDRPIPGLIPTQGTTLNTNKVAVPGSLALAARVSTPESDVWNFHTDWGIKFPIPPRPFVRSRASFTYPLSEWQLKATQSVYWFNTLGVGETSQLDLDHIISPPLLFRSSSIVTWLKDTQNLDMNQSLSIFHTVNDRTALLYQTYATGISNPQYQMTDFVVLVLYRYRMHQQWLYFDLSPQLHFPRDRQYHISPALSINLEMLLDESR